MREDLVKVTTTSGFDGVEIDEYLEPVTAHLVVGMNFFKDFFASFTDFFGGKSNSYQRVLASMNEDVINELRKKTLALGGNCILGLKIDNDEISAKDKSMLMVTAIGTAAKARFPIKEKERDTKKTNSIDLDYFNFLRQKNQYIEASENNTLQFNEEFWNFIKLNKIFELAPYILERYLKFIIENNYTYTVETTISLTNKIIEYLSVLDIKYVTDCIYEKFLKYQHSDARKNLLGILEALHLIDFDQILKLLNSDSFDNQKASLWLLQPYKGNYQKEDIEYINEIANFIDKKFKERCSWITKKKLLTAKEKDIWVCECGFENEAEEHFCKSCYKDKFGFFGHDQKPAETLGKLNIELKILNEAIEL